MEKLKALQRLEESLAKLPGVGKKSAERMAYSMLSFSDEDLLEISESIKDLKTNIRFCKTCGMISEEDECEICKDKERDESIIMVVSYPKDAISIEKSGTYNGKYHILNGEISLSKGIHIENLNLPSLYERLSSNKVREIILATNPTIDGETTALYLAKNLEKYNVNVTRLAYGLQMGGNLEYVDPLTLSKALEGRHKL